MNHRVPKWEMEGSQRNSTRNSAYALSNMDSFRDSESMWDCEVAELTWQNGQLAMHGLGSVKPSSCKSLQKQVWERNQTSGTLECIVNQGTKEPDKPSSVPEAKDLSPWALMDALVPCFVPDASSPTLPGSDGVPHQSSFHNTLGSKGGAYAGSCQGPLPAIDDRDHHQEMEGQHERCSKRKKLAAMTESSRSGANLSVSGSAALGREDTFVSADTYETSDRVDGLTTPTGSRENTSTAKDEQDSVCHSRSKMEEEISENCKSKGQGARSSTSTRRSRAAATHNQSERKRRDRINQKMKALQKLVPNSSKTDKASVLDEVIEYLKQLQATVQIMSQSNMQQMMMPMNMQQLQMCMLAQMSMGANAGIRPGAAGASPVLNPSSFLPPGLVAASAASGSSDRMRERMAGAPLHPDPFSGYLACQAQTMNVDPFKMAAMYQQLFRQLPSNVNGSME